jgi:nicotinamide-nucleotide amidase
MAVSELSAELQASIEALATALRARGWMLTTAESCTGGLIAAACTSVAGSSDWFERGFVTYSNAAKSDLLGVPAALIAQHAVAVTGVAGPGGGSVTKPVGTVWMAVGKVGAATEVELLQLVGDRAAVRAQTVAHAVNAVIKAAHAT